jgi:hypothetical protein
MLNPSMHIVKSVGVMSVAKIMGLIYGCMGLFVAPFFLMVGLLSSMVAPNRSPAAGIFGVGMGIGLVIFVPVFYGVIGFVMGALGALLYNVFARWLGGIEMELEVRPTTLTAPYPIIPPVTASPNS